ncbi:carbohydrate ABC transporter permease [Acholeplasma manati]|uniref:Carbohydrate ABC transporter permease n=1 Tax=Paracholeplasma manati TaxID=591373 RepID=A0ABT2Y467_9MOLU|nr:carbohydrate ABC transporter permease [Paracholeplasma manati]MCV2231526.1 carbohydrate ABC transporter permease [Paracholeplasma manati]
MASFNQTKINPQSFHYSQIKFLIYLVPLAIVMMLPIIYIVSTAFKPMDELFAYPPRFFVINPTLNNFVNLFRQTSQSGIPFSRYIFNSIVVSSVGVTLTILITSMAAYGLSKLKFKIKKPLFVINQYALMFVSVAVTIPRFLIIVNIGLYDTFWAHILPLLAMPVGLFLVKQFVDQVPDALLEAAKIDGATEYQIFWHVVIPIIKPALATVAILAFQTFWNNEVTSQLYITNDSNKTISFFLSTITSGSGVAGAGMSAAASLIMFLPNIIFFILIQNKVMDTMAHSGIK